MQPNAGMQQPMAAKVYLLPPKSPQEVAAGSPAAAAAASPSAPSFAEMQAEKAYQDAIANGATPDAALAGKNAMVTAIKAGVVGQIAVEAFQTAEAAVTSGESAAAAESAGVMSAKVLSEGYLRPAVDAAGKAAAMMTNQKFSAGAAEVAAFTAAKAIQAGRAEADAMKEAAGEGMRQAAIDRGSTPAAANVAKEAVEDAMAKGKSPAAALTGGESAAAAIDKGIPKGAALKGAEAAAVAVDQGKPPEEALATAKATAESASKTTKIVIELKNGVPSDPAAANPAAVIRLTGSKKEPAVAAAPSAAAVEGVVQLAAVNYFKPAENMQPAGQNATKSAPASIVSTAGTNESDDDVPGVLDHAKAIVPFVPWAAIEDVKDKVKSVLSGSSTSSASTPATPAAATPTTPAAATPATPATPAEKGKKY